MSDEIKPGTLIQITNPENKWYPCVLIVDEVKSWGVQAYVTVPMAGEAYYRVNAKDFVVVGAAKIFDETGG